jgi:hypothetical protein
MLPMPPERTPLPLADDTCTSCGKPGSVPHAEDCLFAEHQAMAAGDEVAKAIHDMEDCYWCAALEPPTLSSCRCGNCCRRLLIQVTLEDAKREPKIRERGSPIYTAAEMTVSGRKELEGYLLNSQDNSYACAFLDQTTNLCQIYGSRPLICRLFDCDDSDVQQADSILAAASLPRDEGTVLP